MEQTDKQFKQILLQLNRFINCLTDQDRNTRFTGLDMISKKVGSMQPALIIRLFSQTNLQQYLVKRTLWDKIQKNREYTLKIINTFNSKVKDQVVKSDLVKPFIEQLIKRINNTPFPQTSEDLRLSTIQLLATLLKTFSESFIWYIPELTNALSKTLLDPYAEIKHASCSLINNLCEKVRDNIGQHSNSIIKSLSINLTHQHSKVRKQTLTTVGKLLITPNAGNNFQHIQVGIKSSLSDKSANVRKQALICNSVLLKGFGPKYMKLHEAFLVGNLLCGLNDQDQSNIFQSIKLLQECGQSIKQFQGQGDHMIQETEKMSVQQ